MRRVLVAFSIILLYIVPAKSQTFKVGVLAGVNMTDVDGMDPVDFDNDFKKFGFTFGGYVGVNLTQKTRLQMEIAYSQKGSQYPPYVDTTTVATSNPPPNQGNINNNYYYLLRLNYINVDITLRHNLQINFGKKPTDRFSIEGGASLGYMFHYYYEAQSIQYDLPLKTTDISLFAGFSYNFSDNFCIDLRYYNSILSIFQSDGSSGTNSQWLYYGSWNRGHNLNFQITFKYTFGGGETSTSDNTAPAAQPAQ
jgi:hypothetical protein